MPPIECPTCALLLAQINEAEAEATELFAAFEQFKLFVYAELQRALQDAHDLREYINDDMDPSRGLRN